MKADGPVVAEHGRRRLKKVRGGKRDVLNEGAETSQECKEAVCRGTQFPGVWKRRRCCTARANLMEQVYGAGAIACLPPPWASWQHGLGKSQATVRREAKTGRGERKGSKKTQEE